MRRRGLRFAGLALLALAIPSASAAAAPSPAAEARGRPFWLALAKDCAVPSGESAFDLVSEAIGLLGSTDTEWRDDVGYGVVAACAYQERLLKPEERRALIGRLSANLRRGIGEAGTDSVLLRSFSVLDLSIFTAVESEDPALDEAGYRRLLDDALAYLRDERDLRGLLLSVVRRSDFDPVILPPWLERFVALEKQVWEKAPPDRALLDTSQNARNLLRSFYVLLSLPQPGPTPGQVAAREKVLATLQQIRR